MLKTLVIDIRMIRSGGIGTYIREVVPGLVQQLSYRRLRLLVADGAEFEVHFRGLFGDAEFEVLEQSAKIYSPSEQLGYLKSSSREFDLFWAPHLNLPWLFRPTVVTVHDTFHLSRPDISKAHERAYMRIALNRLKANAAAVITVSEFSKNEILRHIKFPSEKIHVIPHAYGLMEQGKDVSRRTSTSQPFILFVGNLKPHKNLKTLVAAFAAIQDRVPHDLWIAGHQAGMRTVDGDIEVYKKMLGGRLKLLGRVADDELMELYRTASAFVAPSTYEGFGLTPIEALRAGTPVLASDIPAHREFLKEDVVYFSPEDVSDLSSKLAGVLAKPPEPVGRISRSWESVISEHRNVFNALGY